MRRQLIPLALIYANRKKPIQGRTRLQKMIFLLQKELDEEGEYPLDDRYQFVPYDYGPFSRPLYEDLDELYERGFINELSETVDYGDTEGQVKYQYSLQPSGVSFLEDRMSDDDFQKILQKAEQIKKEFNNMALSQLLEIVYSEYPEYTENSVL